MKIESDLSLLWYVIAYGIVMVILGIYYSKKISKSEDYILAGKSLGTLVLTGTLLATWVGSGSITGGQTSMAYSYGLIPALLLTFPTVIGIIILYFISPKIRSLGKYTVSEILEEKYGTYARLLAGVIIILAYVGIVSYQMKGVGFILNLTTGISVEWGTIIGSALIIFLATIGGLRSVAPTDAISVGIMVIGLLVALPFMFVIAGGWDEITANVPATHLTFTGSLTNIQLLGYLLPPLFLLLGDQNMYQRLAASKGDKNSKKAQIGWIIGILIITPVIVLIAFASSSMFKNIEPGMALIVSTLALPNIVGGLLLAAATAFIITTGNSFLLSGATNVTYDIVNKYFKKDATDKQLLGMTKLFVIVLGILSFVLIRFFPTILSVQMYAYTIYGAGLTPALLGVFLWKRVNKAGGLSSMMMGVLTTLLWELVLSKPYDINSSVIAVPVAIIVLIVVTLTTSNKQPQRT
ncbi:sodium:solute symporter family protein [Virgibacillus necropolis]|uniref:Sodium:proline symporter n=1 Tax=Virgibacillus necropolis TaxID=163877 RepID=A0A221MCM8_9BACI|nr:sodium:solute symporter family protein [Virgibacillus necropolis]ASN05391.1 sodium:proline symporter [Virgibacillus necropolis]